MATGHGNHNADDHHQWREQCAGGERRCQFDRRRHGSISANAASGTLLNDTDLNSDPLTVTALGAGAGQPLAGLTPVPGGGAAVSGVWAVAVVA